MMNTDCLASVDTLVQRLGSSCQIIFQWIDHERIMWKNESWLRAISTWFLVEVAWIYGYGTVTHEALLD
jgi:hypothetical protein